MSIDFLSPTYRAAGTDLVLNISPLGLVELADEEFEVHGPRLNRYALNWALYLGHHWSHRREIGEHQHTSNFYRAFTDYLARFTFGSGVKFESQVKTEAVVPDLLERVWQEDNDKERVLLEMAQQGGVSGDCFVKVAYEEPYVDSINVPRPGRVRLLPLNAAHCFPEWHPHDRTRLLRMKIKYRFWGCVDPETEALTRDGWKTHRDLKVGDEILSLDPDTDEIRWEPVERVNVYDYEGDLHRWTGKVDALTTPNHRWLGETLHGRGSTMRYQRRIIRSGEQVGDDPDIHAVRNGGRLVVGGGTPLAFRTDPKWSDEAVETVAWYITEGWDHTNQTGVRSVYLAQKRPAELAQIRRLASWWRDQGATFSEYAPKKDGVVSFYLGSGVKQFLWDAAPGKQITPEFLTSLTYRQAVLFYEALLDGDGHRRASRAGGKPSVRWTQVDDQRKAGFQMLAAMMGIRTKIAADNEKVQAYQDRWIGKTAVLDNEEVVPYKGQVWCPTLPSGIWMARRNGTTYWTGNTSLEGTRQVFTYTEILTDDVIEEYLNDELIDSRPNPVGIVPVVHIANRPVSGSPWGLPDCQDIIAINRQYNEIATSVADIINYHAEPITIITGAKASQLERGAKKIWAGLPKDAKVENLEGGYQGLQSALAYLELLKRTMHEMVGVPETALGQVQPISNTSGVALSIQFQPLMNVHRQKIAQYGFGIQRINEIVLRTLAVKEPNSFIVDPSKSSVPLDAGQLPRLDPRDPDVYVTVPVFPPPLPLDKLVLLNEIQAKFSLGLESREGALRLLGEEFPEEKLVEIRQELMDDALADGALNLVKMQIQGEIAQLTGMMAGPDGSAIPAPPPMPMDVTGDEVPDIMTGPGMPQVPDPYAEMMEQQLRQKLVETAYGTKMPQRRVKRPDASG